MGGTLAHCPASHGYATDLALSPYLVHPWICARAKRIPVTVALAIPSIFGTSIGLKQTIDGLFAQPFRGAKTRRPRRERGARNASCRVLSRTFFLFFFPGNFPLSIIFRQRTDRVFLKITTRQNKLRPVCCLHKQFEPSSSVHTLAP